MKQTTAPRLEYIDVARGIAMICIVLGHLGSPDINRVVFTFHVPVFYLITGYFVSDHTSLRAFIGKRARTLLVPYAITALLVTICNPIVNELILGGKHSKDLMLTWAGAALYGAGDAWDLPFFPFHIGSMGAIWFLWASFWGSIALRLLLNKTPRVRALTVLVVFSVSVWLAYQRIWLPLSIQAGGCGLAFMYMGWLWRKLGSDPKPANREARFALMLLCVGVWFCFVRDFRSFWLVHNDLGRGAVDVFGSLCACYALVRACDWICKKRIPIKAPLASFGKWSLVALCVHELELYVCPWQLLKDGLAAMGFTDLNALLVLIACKLALIFAITAILVHAKPVLWLFGYSAKRDVGYK